MGKKMKNEDYFQIRNCSYPDEKRIRLQMKKYEIYMLKGTHWEYIDAYNTELEAQQYIQNRISKFPKH